MVSDDARKAISKNAVDAATEAACKEKLRFYPKVLFLMSSLAFQE